MIKAHKDEIVPVTIEEKFVENEVKVSKSHVADMDEGVEGDTTLETLSKLDPHQIGYCLCNSSQTSDEYLLFY